MRRHINPNIHRRGSNFYTSVYIHTCIHTYIRKYIYTCIHTYRHPTKTLKRGWQSWCRRGPRSSSCSTRRLAPCRPSCAGCARTCPRYRATAPQRPRGWWVRHACGVRVAAFVLWCQSGGICPVVSEWRLLTETVAKFEGPMTLLLGIGLCDEHARGNEMRDSTSQ
jgi:hypothetical protein